MPQFLYLQLERREIYLLAEALLSFSKKKLRCKILKEEATKLYEQVIKEIYRQTNFKFPEKI